MPDTALVVMARYPEGGKIKTRLARIITAAYLARRRDLYDDYLHSGTPTFDLHRADQPM